MYPEYLYNNDTQDIVYRVSELATADEPALRAHCQEVSRQRDTSSLSAIEDCGKGVNDTLAVLSIIAKTAEDFSRVLCEGAGVFRTRNGKSDFPTVCQAVTRIEAERLHLLECITSLTQVRRKIASEVAETNRVLHTLSVARRAVPEDVRVHYTKFAEDTKVAYERLTTADAALREVQAFSMATVERHLPVFMERLRTAADFNHAGEALEKGAICALCSELQILLSRVPNVSF
jgi:hypothetical protein